MKIKSCQMPRKNYVQLNKYCLCYRISRPLRQYVDIYSAYTPGPPSPPSDVTVAQEGSSLVVSWTSMEPTREYVVQHQVVGEQITVDDVRLNVTRYRWTPPILRGATYRLRVLSLCRSLRDDSQSLTLFSLPSHVVTIHIKGELQILLYLAFCRHKKIVQ